MIRSYAAALLAASVATAAFADIRITEVHATGNSNTTYQADWFEVTNFGASAVDITGWRMDDNSNSLALSVAIRGLTALPAGSSVVFLENGTSSANDPTLQTNFINAWFGGTAPANLLFAFYGGSGVGLSSGGDAVNLFNSGGTVVANVSFGLTTAGTTFDNAAGLSGAISQLSVVGVNNAFQSTAGGEVGSPGVIPAPTAGALLALGGLAALRRRR